MSDDLSDLKDQFLESLYQTSIVEVRKIVYFERLDKYTQEALIELDLEFRAATITPDKILKKEIK